MSGFRISLRAELLYTGQEAKAGEWPPEGVLQAMENGRELDGTLTLPDGTVLPVRAFLAEVNTEPLGLHP